MHGASPPSAGRASLHPAVEALPFRQIVIDDFEFHPDDNLNPHTVCFSTRELRTGQRINLARRDLGSRHPFNTDRKDTVTIGHAVSAEVGCYLDLGWPLPAYLLDTFCEYRNLTNLALSKNDPRVDHGGLLSALRHFGLGGITADEKDEWRQLILSKGPWSHEQMAGILAYCESDVESTERLLPFLLPTIDDLAEALNRGRYMRAVARVERVGTPIDMPTFHAWSAHREEIAEQLVEEFDRDHSIYAGISLNSRRFDSWLERHGIQGWPRTATGHPKTDKDTLKDWEGAHPAIEHIKELQKTLTGMRKNSLAGAIGADGRNRASIWAFGASSSRNTPKAGEFVFGQAKWYRCLIRPEPGYTVASFDYSQQEFAIAAVLSGDEAMMDAYRTGDAYMGMAIQAGRAPPGATKSTHAAVRGIFKTISLGLLYGAGAATIGRRLCVSPSEAKALLRNHRAMYPKYWAWNERIGHQSMYYNELSTVFGWKTRPYPGIAGEPPNIRTLRNFPMQANGGEILRLATSMLVESGVDVCALVHDAIVIISPTSRFEEDRAKTMAAMKAASRRVLGGFAVDVEMNSASYPNRYIDKDGAAMWRRIEQLLRDADRCRA